MNEAKHTRGPWHYHAKLSGSENHRGFRVYGASQWVFCEVQPGDEDGREGEANARLITAAPDLLAAAQTVLADLNARIAIAGDGPVPVFRGIADLHAAIAKATGSAS